MAVPVRSRLRVLKVQTLKNQSLRFCFIPEPESLIRWRLGILPENILNDKKSLLIAHCLLLTAHSSYRHPEEPQAFVGIFS